ncbi:MAG: iron-only hydrogenase system regulator [Oscillospiraceae bacterium]|nr:iron-only hydrogenase system regulator [Oscillospiraceae bacterium]
METKVAVISIIVEDDKAVTELNSLLHEFGPYIIGRLGIPYRVRDINIICVALDAPEDKISALAEKLGKVEGVNAKVTYSNV